jgi:hypothetical protein
MVEVHTLTAASKTGDAARVGSVRTGDQALIAISLGDPSIPQGAVAAQHVVRVALEHPAAPSAEALAGRLREADHQVRALAAPGLASGGVLSVRSGRIEGASVGDLSAWCFSLEGRRVELTALENHRPLLGSGEAQVVPFKTTFGVGTVVMACDAVWQMAGLDAIAALARSGRPLSELAEAVVDLSRLETGALVAPVGLAVARVSD